MLADVTAASAPRLGCLKRRVVDHLWSDRLGERWFTVREVHEELAREREIAYTTVMTVLQRLSKKRLALEAASRPSCAGTCRS
jgi:predicted transcriptional regulator